MAQMDICTCKIMLGGDRRQVVFRGPTNPLTYPEVNLMMFTHGDRSVTDITVIGTVETNNTAELNNLRVKYRGAAREAFPGQRPRLPLMAPDDIPRNIVEAPEHKTMAAEPVPEGKAASPAQRRRKPKTEAA